MKPHTSNWKNNITEMGRQFRSIVTYGQTTLEEELYSVTPHYEANLLKSVMKQLDIESSVNIPKDTILNYQLGIKVNATWEYLNYGNYVVFSSEKQEDTDTYKIVCYDKMLYAMKQNEDLGVTYPITIKNYLTALATKIGLTVKTGTFVNESMTIPAELYVGLEYTYRDILDEIAQATGSNIVIDNNDRLEVRYFTSTGDTIDEDFLKDVNVNFGEKYGPINSIVLSRSAGSDNVYLRDDESIALNGLCEIKISDNQIMNFNNRSQFLPGLLNVLGGFYYYLNDFTSTGICYYDVCDLYNISIGENTYQCAMLNDEIDVTMGIEELIHTDRPEQSETDYDKADKTDRRINETYLIVDKQNQTIEAVVSNVSQQNSKIAELSVTVDELSAKIQENMDFTTSGETTLARMEIDNVSESNPITVKIHPINENISYLYPNTGLFPGLSSLLKVRTLRFVRTYIEDEETKTENIDYELPDDLLYYDSANYDEFYLDFTTQTCQITKKCQYNADGTVSLLAEPIIEDYSENYPVIPLGEGDYEIKLLGYDTGYVFVRLLADNAYTYLFATKQELATSIEQTTQSITASVNAEIERLDGEITNVSGELSLKLDRDDNDQVVSMLNASADVISFDAGRLLITSGNFMLDAQGNITAKGGTIGGFNITNSYLANGTSSLGGANNSVYLGIDGISCGTSFKVTKAGVLYCSNAEITGSLTTIASSGAKVQLLNGALVTYTANGYQGWEMGGQIMYAHSHITGSRISYLGPIGQNAMGIYATNNGTLSLGTMTQDLEGGSNVMSTAMTISDTRIYLNKPLWVNDTPGASIGKTGYPVLGANTDHTYFVYWTGSVLQLYVDNTYIGKFNLS